MLFKNLTVYNLKENPDLTDLEEKIAAKIFVDAGINDPWKVGFTNPSQHEGLYLEAKDYILFAIQIEDKVIPASLVDKMVNEQAKQWELRTKDKARAKVRKQLKEDIMHDLKRRALSKFEKIHGYLDLEGGLLVVDTASPTKAETFCTQLRSALGSLKIELMQSSHNNLLTRLLKPIESHPLELSRFVEVGSSALLKDRSEAGKIKLSEEDLYGDTIQDIIGETHRVIELNMRWRQELKFTLTDNMVFKSVKPMTLLSESFDGAREEDGSLNLQASMIIIGSLVRHLIKDFRG